MCARIPTGTLMVTLRERSGTGVEIFEEMARPKRFELLTPRFVVWCSIQLSYGRVFACAFGPSGPDASGQGPDGRKRALCLPAPAPFCKARLTGSAHPFPMVNRPQTAAKREMRPCL